MRSERSVFFFTVAINRFDTFEKPRLIFGAHFVTTKRLYTRLEKTTPLILRQKAKR